VGLDTLRALAIVGVMVCHLDWVMPRSVGPAAQFGWMGVDMFFVLSGYLIGLQLLRPVSRGERLSVTGFYRKRAYRILPAYLVVLLAYVLLNLRSGYSGGGSGMAPLWEFLTFTENLFADHGRDFQFQHVWSLCVEEHFYLVLPVMVVVLARRPAVWKTVSLLACFSLLGAALRSYELLHGLRHLMPGSAAFEDQYYNRIYDPTYTRLDGLLAGVSLALLRVYRPAVWSAMARYANGLVVTGCGLTGIAVWMFAGRLRSTQGMAAVGTVIGFPVLSFGFALLVFAAAEPRCWLGRLRVPGARLVATLAYSLYLTHREVGKLINLLLPRLAGTRDWRSMLVVAVSCLGVAGVLYLGVERPFLALRERREGRDTGSVDLEARVEPAL
jgi:peptidoglycan/LPS O-acetylase OafA/YrhL